MSFLRRGFRVPLHNDKSNPCNSLRRKELKNDLVKIRGIVADTAG